MPENIEADRLEQIDREMREMIDRVVDARFDKRIDRDAISSIESLSHERVALTRPQFGTLAA